MSFPNVVIMLIGGIALWWALNQLGLLSSDKE